MGGDQAGQPRAGLDHDTGVPLYHQIEVILRERIVGGDLPPGTAVPGEQALCDTYGVSRITARRALNELARTGLVVRAPGRGTRVADRPPLPVLSSPLEGWLQAGSEMARRTSVEVLAFDHGPAGPEVAAALGLGEEATVQRNVRVRRLGAEPMSYLVSCLPEEVGRLIAPEDLDATPLVSLLERAGVSVAAADQTIGATLADPVVGAALRVPAGAPLLEARRIVHDADGRPVQHTRALYRPEMYRICVRMERVGGAWSSDRRRQDLPAEDAL